MIDRAETEPNILGPESGLAGSATRSPFAALVGFVPVVGCCALLSLAAHVRVPLPGTDVPMTLQLLAVLLTGFALSPAKSVAATVVYLAIGTAGAPVFAPGSTGLFGPTGGYIAGFVAAAWLISVFKGDGKSSYARLLFAGSIGTLAVFVFGIAWRIIWLGGNVELAVMTGFVPFIPKAAVELFLSLAIVTSVRRARRGLAARTAL